MGIFQGAQDNANIDAAAAKDAAAKRVLSPEAKKAQDERREARRIAFDKVQEIVKDNLKKGLFGDKDAASLTDLLKVLTPLRSSTPTTHDTICDKIARLFDGKKVVSGYDVYQFEGAHWGASDMKRNIVLGLKTAESDKRMWVEYDAKNDNYNLIYTGPTPPLGWTGYVPVDAV